MRFQNSTRWEGNRHDGMGALRRNALTALLTLGCLLGFSVLATPAQAKDRRGFKPFKMKTLDGEKKTLADYTNKVILVAFFYPQCPFCNQALPNVQEIYDKYRDKGLSMVWINVVPEEDKLIPKWIEEHDFTAPVLIGKSQPSLMRDYDLKATPTNFLLDESGAVLLRQDGYKPGDEEVLEAKIATVLNAAH